MTNTDTFGRTKETVSQIIGLYFMHVATKNVYTITQAVLVKTKEDWEWGVVYVEVDITSHIQKDDTSYVRSYRNFFGVDAETQSLRFVHVGLLSAATSGPARTVLHVKVGDDERSPSAEELQAIIAEFNAAASPTHGFGPYSR